MFSSLLAALAQAPRWAAAIEAAGLDPGTVAEIEASSAYGALSTALRRADAHGLPVEASLSRLAAGACAESADPAAVLHARVEAFTTAAIRAGRAATMDTVAGLLPAVRGEVAADFGAALSEWSDLMEQRIDDGHGILPVGGHLSARWRSWILPAGGHEICPTRSFRCPGLHGRGSFPGSAWCC